MYLPTSGIHIPTPNAMDRAHGADRALRSKPNLGMMSRMASDPGNSAKRPASWHQNNEITA